MSIEENKALIRRMYEFLNQRQVDAYIELINPDCILHTGATTMSREQEKEADVRMLAAFPDITSTIEDIVAEGDKVAFRVTHRGTHEGNFLGISPTGKKTEVTDTAIYRVAGGKVVEGWATIDTLRLLQQLGVIPVRGQGQE